MPAKILLAQPAPGLGSALLGDTAQAVARNASRPLFVGLHVALFFVLHLAYVKFVSKAYGYLGFTEDFSSLKLLASVFLVAFAALITPKDNKPSSLFLHFTVALVLTPSLVLYSDSNLPNGFALLTFVCVMVVRLVGRSARLALPSVGLLHPHSALFLLVALVLVFVISFGIYDGFKFLNFDFSQVYDFRDAAREKLPGAYSYLTPIITKSLIPLAIVLACVYRLRMVVAALAAASIILFAITAHKSMAFYPATVVFLYYVGLKTNLTRNFLLALLVLTVFSISYLVINLGGYGLNGEWAANLFIRRAIFTPSFLNNLYYDFFTVNTVYMWADSKITLGLLENPYSIRAPALIGEVYFDNQYMSANTGWIGSGMANAGTFGALLYSVLLGCILSFLDSSAKRWGVSVVVAVTIIPVFSAIMSTDFLTLFLTHGMLFTLLGLVLISPPDHAGPGEANWAQGFGAGRS